MKKIFLVFSLTVLALMALAAPVYALGLQGGAAADPVLDAVQMYLIGVLASAVVYALKLIGARWPQWTIKREWLTVLLYVCSWGLAILWRRMTIPSFPAFDDPTSFVSALLAFAALMLEALGPAVAFATLVYNVLLKQVFDGWAEKSGLIKSSR